ncbi:hypothetical protein [Thalassospira profundimaris]|uniref:hypothetical protein n=1 Tax=Thalassospira profundimaris TaxID=502049 RepID=UPI0002873519|nr:hypothetical protein [Thalassospira profundimaris]EKF10348.1 hypothetical protein TH2_03240 [Thalassospira profundimaris WP0211]
MSTQSFDELLAKLDNARDRRLPWTEIAMLINAIEKTPAGKQYSANKEHFWEMLAQKTRYTRNALQRMRSTLIRGNAIADREKMKLQEILGQRALEPNALFDVLGHFHTAELFARIHSADPDAALDLLAEMRDKKVPVVRIKEILSEVTNRKYSSSAAPTFLMPKDALHRKDALALIDEHKSLLYGGDDVSIYFKRYNFEFVSIDAVGIRCGEDGALQLVDGFMFMTGSPGNNKLAFQNLLSDIDYRSSFFRHVWLCRNSSFRWPSEEINFAIDALDIHQAGIIEFDETGSEMKIVRRPKGNDRPSRYSLTLREIMRQGIPDFGMV